MMESVETGIVSIHDASEHDPGVLLPLACQVEVVLGGFLLTWPRGLSIFGRAVLMAGVERATDVRPLILNLIRDGFESGGAHQVVVRSPLAIRERGEGMTLEVEATYEVEPPIVITDLDGQIVHVVGSLKHCAFLHDALTAITVEDSYYAAGSAERYTIRLFASGAYLADFPVGSLSRARDLTDQVWFAVRACTHLGGKDTAA